MMGACGFTWAPRILAFLQGVNWRLPVSSLRTDVTGEGALETLLLLM